MTDRSVSRLRWLAVPAAVAVPLLGLAIGIFAPIHLPFVDFPQHVAMVSIWSHLDDPTRGLAGRYAVDLATPYATGYLVAHVLAPLFGDEGAVRVVLFLSLAAIPLAALAVLRAYRRPPELAIAAFAVGFSWVTFMGFVEFIVAVPMVIGSVALVASVGRTRWAVPVLAVLALAAFVTHAFALPMVALVSVGAAIGPGWRGRLPGTVVALTPAVLVGALWAIGRSHTPSPDPMPFSMGNPLTRLGVLRYLFGSDVADLRVIALSIALIALALGAAIVVRRERRDGRDAAVEPPDPGRPRSLIARAISILAARPLLGATAAAAVGYALTPLTVLDSYGIWQRFAPVAFVLGLGLIPWPRSLRPRAMLTAALVVLTCVSSLATLAQSSAFDRQIAGLDAVILSLPPGQRLFYREPDVRSAGVGVDALRHLGAEYVTLRGGDISYNFTMFPHLVVRDRQPRTIATESPVYQFELRLVVPCGPAQSPPPSGPVVASAGDWRAYAVTVPLVRPPSRSLDTMPPATSC